MPSEPGFGIAKSFDESDQRLWTVSCGPCGKQQVLDFYENVRWDEFDGHILDPRIVCSSCERVLDVRRGEWIARFPERNIPGFHVSRLIVPGADLVRLIEASQRKQPYQQAAFFRNGLGKPYAEQSTGLDRTALAAAVSAGAALNGGVPLRMPSMYSGPNFVTAGVDVASTRAFNVRISEHLDPLDAPRARKRALFIGTAETPGDVVALLRRYCVHFACIDALPEQRIARLIADQFPGQVYLVLHTSQREPLRVDSDRGMITVNRTYLLDTMTAEFHTQMNLLPEDLPSGYTEQMTAVRRVVTRTESGSSAKWCSQRPDDYFHAEAYDTAATMGAIYRILELSQSETEAVVLTDIADFEPSHVADFDWLSTLALLDAQGRHPRDDRHGFYV